MLRLKKNKSILSSLQDRELNNKCAPYFQSANIVSLLLRYKADDELYRNYWKKESPRPITYDSGYLYFSDYTTSCSVYGDICNFPSTFNLEKSNSRMKVSDVISYSLPILRDFEGKCTCNLSSCACLPPYILTVTDDNWLCQHLMTSGKLVRQYYVNRVGHKFRFKYCDWDVYGDRFILTSTLNPEHTDCGAGKKSDIVVNLAIFNAFPFEFLALLEIKRSIFGESATAANISDQHLILGLGSNLVHIYNFEEFLKDGNLVEYRLGQQYADGKIGYPPIGLPLNFQYTAAPPLLFKVQCYGQIIRFGGFPYHFITASARNSCLFNVTNMETGQIAIDGSLQSYSMTEDVDALLFHPDHSNRVIFKTDNVVDCYNLTNINGISKIDKAFSMGFFGCKEGNQRQSQSSFGRRYKSREFIFDGFASIFCSDYASDLDLFAIMGVYCDMPRLGFVKLYDSLTGDEVRTIQLKRPVCDSNFYQLYVDMGTVIIIERKCLSNFTAHVYNM